MMCQKVDVITVSGGKDSAAMWMLAVEQGANVMPVFNDTGHEHPTTYEYLEYLETRLGPLKRIKADFSEQIARKRELVISKWRDEGVPESIIADALEVLQPTGSPFLDLCIWKGRFPSTKARFCTLFLKVKVMLDNIYLPLLEQGNQVTSWQGVRAQESRERAKLPEREMSPDGYEIYRPLLNWTVDEVFEMHRKHGIEPNPLYMQGMGRVGCMPCINCNKNELFEIARRFPKEVERMRKWEDIVARASKRGDSAFFPPTHGEWYRIDKWIEWSKTLFGGQQYDLFKYVDMQDDTPLCSSQYGLCE